MLKHTFSKKENSSIPFLGFLRSWSFLTVDLSFFCICYWIILFHKAILFFENLILEDSSNFSSFEVRNCIRKLVSKSRSQKLYSKISIVSLDVDSFLHDPFSFRDL